MNAATSIPTTGIAKSNKKTRLTIKRLVMNRVADALFIPIRSSRLTTGSRRYAKVAAATNGRSMWCNRTTVAPTSANVTIQKTNGRMDFIGVTIVGSAIHMTVADFIQPSGISRRQC